MRPMSLLVLFLMAAGVGGLATGCTSLPAEEISPLAQLEAISQASQQLAEQAIPAVVFITAEKKVAMGGDDVPLTPFFDDPMFRRFFGDPGSQPRQRPQERLQQGQGSGFLISADGFIVTNHHVAGGADRVTVRLHDKREFTARVVGSDERTDVALLRIEADAPLPALPLGDSGEVAQGQWVMAIGNPFGLSHTVTSGIVSSRGRGHVGIVDYEDFIQTDAAINPGNSGGPLLNVHGQVIAINSAIYSRSGGNMGIGFAIPINLAKKVIDQLKENGAVARGRIGVMIQDLTPDLAKSFALPGNTGGILVSQVVPGSPAADAKLQVGDVIIELNDQPVTSVATFRNAIALTRPGTKATLTLWRQGERVTAELTVGNAEGTEVALQGAADGQGGQLGLHLGPLTDEIRQRLGVEKVEGVLITAVDDDGPAIRAGLRAGMILQQVNATAVTGVDAAITALTEARKAQAPVRLLVRDQNGTRFVILRTDG